MPFFWLIKQAVDSQWYSAKSRAGATVRSHHERLCEFVKTTPVGAVLEEVEDDDCVMLYELYLHDFVRSVHKCKYKKAEHNTMEYQLISNALNQLVKFGEFQLQSLTSRIAALHLVYVTHKSHILWFGQLVQHFPNILSLLVVSEGQDRPEMELHLHTAMRVMDKLEPPLQKDNPNPNLTQWLNWIRQSRNAITSILNIKSGCAIAQEARLCWQRLLATQLFVEHVMLKHPTVDLKLPARRLCGLWKGNADFLKASTVKSAQLQINGMETKLKKSSVDKETIKHVKKSCREFFMELVSSLCFGGEAAPEPALVKMLLDTVFVEKNDSTQDLTPYKDDKADKVPTIRSFLLQLLLEHSMDQVRDHLMYYLDRSYRRVISVKEHTNDQNLYLLIIQCFEDSMAKKFSCQCFPAKAHTATAILMEGYYAIREHHQGTPTLEYLEGVAKLRYSLSVVAELLKSKDDMSTYEDLLHAARQVCTDREVNCIDPTDQKDTVGPVIYLLKLIVRQYGTPSLKVAAETHNWIIPAELKSDEDKSVDLFVVYGNAYKSLRISVSGALYGDQMDDLQQSVQNLQPHEVVLFIMALYERATLSRMSASPNPANRISRDALERLNEFIVNFKLMSNEQRLTARALLANQQGGRILEQMSVSPQQPLQCRTILGVVVHATAVFFNKQAVGMLLPFVNILNNPAALNHSYLPTMPEDQLMASRVVMKAGDPNGKFYECPRGHRYFVGDCGQVTSQGECNVCCAPIGGAAYNTLVQGNKPATLQDTTKFGHDLGAPQNRTLSSPERDLTSRSVCILRALMHTAFVWASCKNESALGAITGLVTPHVLPQQLPEFFWSHLEKDFELLGKETGRGLEENVMTVHLVLRQILTLKPPNDGNIQKFSALGTKEARWGWEKAFDQHYIQPVLKNLDRNLTDSMDMVANDDLQDHDKLFYLVYEKVKYKEDSLEPHLWTFRARIDLEHLRRSLHDKKKKDAYPILFTFLQAETELRATQYLPEISRLQQCLYDKFNRQIDKKDSKKQSIGQFIKELPDETTKNGYREMIDSFRAAWTLVGHKLKNHGRLPVEEKYYVAVIDDETPMEYLVPTTTEAGVCTTALVDFLTLAHNNFIERCRALTAGNDPNAPEVTFWREHKVPITHFHRCHLVDYEHHLHSIILSHCHYSLKVGKGQHVDYDYQALERHILNRFIYGKPLILLDIPQVVYRKDIYSTGTFANVKRKASPQEIIPLRIRQDIVSELRTPDRLRDALDVIEIVLGFLSSGGGKAETPLGDYIDKTLKMKKRRFSEKAKMSCQLMHALSLWETIAVELARQLCLRGQQPFDSIRPEFLRDLSKNEDGEDQITALNCCLGQFEPDLLLGTLYEFIETYVKHCPLHECDAPLVDTLEVVLDQYGANIKLLPLDQFPQSIKLDQAVEAWKHLVQYYAQRH